MDLFWATNLIRLLTDLTFFKEYYIIFMTKIKKGHINHNDIS
jgi:hypothetical protein